MTLHPGADASTPGAPLPAGTSILAAYVGRPGAGAPDALHIWSADEWNDYIEHAPSLRSLPISVHSYDDGNPRADAANAVDAVRALGWAPNMPGAQRRIIVVDCETLIDNAYFAEVQKGINDAGFRAVLYGSASTVEYNHCPGGYYVANYNFSHAPTTLPANCLGIQWKPGGAWDLDVFSDAAYAGCGIGLRHG